MDRDLDVDLLPGTWLHRHEERGEDMVFVRHGTELPPARGRTAITFLAGGAVVVGSPGPDDRSYDTAGSWAIEGDVLTIRSPVLSGTFRVVEASRDRLVIRRQD